MIFNTIPLKFLIGKKTFNNFYFEARNFNNFIIAFQNRLIYNFFIKTLTTPSLINGF